MSTIGCISVEKNIVGKTKDILEEKTGFRWNIKGNDFQCWLRTDGVLNIEKSLLTLPDNLKKSARCSPQNGFAFVDFHENGLMNFLTVEVDSDASNAFLLPKSTGGHWSKFNLVSIKNHTTGLSSGLKHIHEYWQIVSHHTPPLSDQIKNEFLKKISNTSMGTPPAEKDCRFSLKTGSFESGTDPILGKDRPMQFMEVTIPIADVIAQLTDSYDDSDQSTFHQIPSDIHGSNSISDDKF